MKLKFLLLSAIGSILLFTSGCYSDVAGNSHTGMPWVKDRLESRYERPAAQVTEAARTTLKANGTIVSDDIATTMVVGKIDTRTVYVKIDALDPKVTRVLVQARTKGGAADIDLASEIDKQIALNLQK